MYVRSSALLFAIVFVGFSSTIAPARAASTHARHRRHPAAQTADAASQPTHHRKHHHVDSQTASEVTSTTRASRRAALLAKLREQDELLYQLRHERNVYAEKIAHLTAMVEARRAARRSGHDSRLDKKDRDEQAQEAQTASEHKQRSHGKHADAQDASDQGSRHDEVAAKHSAAEEQHEERLAEHEARAAKQWNEHLQRLAEIEAERQKHEDNSSTAVHIASDSGLPVWEGDAYAAQVPVKVVTVNLNDPRIRVSALLARNGIGSSEPFTDMIDRTHPYVAVTGTFFSLDNLRPVGDIVINGSLAYFGGMGTALAIKPDNHADMVTVPWGHHHNWTGYDTVVACGPRLLENGAIVLDPHMEHFKDRHMLAPNSRIAVGITGHNQLVFCMTRDSIYLGRLAKVMRSLGCQQAMNLDAGTSTGFYCDGRLMARPGRWLTNAIVVYTNGKESHDLAQSPASQEPVDRARLATYTSSHPTTPQDAVLRVAERVTGR